MIGFFNLARIKFGDEYVNKFAKGTGGESGNIDMLLNKLKNLYILYMMNIHIE